MTMGQIASPGLFGTSVHIARHVPLGSAYRTPAGIFMHWIDAAMLTFDHEAWWAATPEENAARIVREAVEANDKSARHAQRPLPTDRSQEQARGADTDTPGSV